MKQKITLIFTIILLALFFNQAGAVGARGIPQRVKKVERRYQEVKRGYLQKKQDYQRLKRQYLESKRKIHQWRALSETEKTAHLDQAKEYLWRGIEILIRHFQRWRERIEAARGVDETWREEALTEIDRQINWLEDKRQEVEKASSPAELQEIGQEMRHYWQQHRILIKKFVGRTLVSRVNWIISRAEIISQKLERAINRAEEEGKDVSRAREILADLKEKISLARQKAALAKEKFEAISSPAEADQLFRQGHQFLREAHQYLKEFKLKIKEVWRTLK